MLNFILLFTPIILLMFTSLFIILRLRTWIRSWRLMRRNTFTYVKGNPGGRKSMAILLGVFILLIGLVLNISVLIIVLLIITGNMGTVELLLNIGSNAAYIEASPYGFRYVGPFTNYTLVQIYNVSIEALASSLLFTLLGSVILLAIMRMQPMVRGNPLRS